MAFTVKELVEAVLEDASFDASETQALRWLTGRHRLMCLRSKCYRKTLTVGGGIVPGQSLYAIPPELVELMQVTVGGLVYGHARRPDYAEGERGWLWLGGEGGIAGREDSSQGEAQLRLFPTPPTTAGGSPAGGTTIELYGACTPPDLQVGNDATLKVSAEFEDALVAGAIATGMLRVEGRPDLASPYESIFNNGCSELARQTGRRFRGAGPAQVRVVGINA